MVIIVVEFVGAVASVLGRRKCAAFVVGRLQDLRGFDGQQMPAPWRIELGVDRHALLFVAVFFGLLSGMPPEIDTLNFAPRSRVPTLMINGRDDFLTELEKSQKPLFRLLGVPDDQKRHTLLDGGHIPPDRLAIMNEVLAWFDRFLGPVKTS